MSTLAETHDALMLDLDGTVYLGGQPIDHVAPALARAKQQGARSVFVTNNASRPPAEVAESLTGMGVAAEPDDVLTSPQAAAVMLTDRHPAGTKVLVIGAPWLAESVSAGRSDAGPVGDGRSGGRRSGALAGDRLARTRRGLHRAARRCRLGGLQRRQHPADRSWSAAGQRRHGRRPDRRHRAEAEGGREAGAAAAGRGRSGWSTAKRPLVVGDRLDTDIACAVAAGSPSLLVFTGVSTTRTCWRPFRSNARPTWRSTSAGWSRRITRSASRLRRRRPAAWNGPSPPTAVRSCSPGTAALMAPSPTPARCVLWPCSPLGRGRPA